MNQSKKYLRKVLKKNLWQYRFTEGKLEKLLHFPDNKLKHRINWKRLVVQSFMTNVLMICVYCVLRSQTLEKCFFTLSKIQWNKRKTAESLPSVECCSCSLKVEAETILNVFISWLWALCRSFSPSPVHYPYFMNRNV